MTATKIPTDTVHVIGGGLAGSEAAWQIANAGVPVLLHEMRPQRMTEAHQNEGLAELVCSNSFRSEMPPNNAVGLLHAEMRRLGSLIIARPTPTSAGRRRARGRSRRVFGRRHPRAARASVIAIDRTEIGGLPPADWGNVIVATGPLTSAPLADAIRQLTDETRWRSSIAIAPIVHKDSIDMSVAWFQSATTRSVPAAPAPTTSMPDDQGSVRRIRRRTPGRREGRLQRTGKPTRPIRRLPAVEVMAERGHETLRFWSAGWTAGNRPKLMFIGWT